MKRILIACVNYNTYGHLFRFLDSIADSLKEVPKGELELSVGIADNSSQKQQIELSKYQGFNVNVYALDNLGYFGGASFIINQTYNISNFDFVIISNVDILFTQTTLSELIHAKIPENVAWLSPQRYSTKYEIILKVEKKNRPSKLKMWLYLYMYKIKFLKKIQHKYTLKKYKKRSKTLPEKEEEIYVGCGSCFILTKHFFSVYPQIHYPIFLYGEELFIAELVRKANLKVLYYPKIKIYNIGRVSTKNIDMQKFCQYNIEAIKFIYNNFYKRK